ncbi:MAG TPA: polysaccharide deacetylase family protein [Microvirga sp.]|jgi:peptidoglycan/xylan/chitin deacetylase (PgdA/CDA1 family)
MKDRLLSLLANDRLMRLMRPVRRNGATIFFLHRFHDPARGNDGHSPELLRQALAFLRRHGFTFAPLGDVLATLAAGEEPRPDTVVFTIDDGYADFAEVAGPIFAEFDCPATVFLVTGFLDGQLWLWWDQVEYAIERSPRQNPAIRLDAMPFAATLRTPQDRRHAIDHLTEALKHVDDARKHEFIAELARQLEVALPAGCPPLYAPMTWDQVRRAARQGVSFGPHTVTHPILSQCSDEAARWEIAQSTARLRQETDAMVPVFCYPNGTPWSFSAREEQAVREAGLGGAVTTLPRHVTRARYAADGRAPFAIPRFPFPRDLPRVAGVVGGAEHMRSRIRAAVQAGD